jgi:hypothetical protein
MKGLTLEKTGDDASCRLDSHPVSSAPRRTRTYNPLIQSQQAGSPKSPLPKDLSEPALGVAHYLPTDICKTYPTWPSWSKHGPTCPRPWTLKAGIVAMVRATWK